MHKSHLAVLGALLVLCATGAQGKQKDLVVTGPPTLSQWTFHVGAMLSRSMASTAYSLEQSADEGIVAVRFRCTEDGRPGEVAVARSSGSPRIDEAAVRAVRWIKTLHPLPEGLHPSQRYEAVMLYALTQASHDRQIAAIRSEAARRNAWIDNTTGRLALGVHLVPSS